MSPKAKAAAEAERLRVEIDRAEALQKLLAQCDPGAEISDDDPQPSSATPNARMES